MEAALPVVGHLLSHIAVVYSLPVGCGRGPTSVDLGACSQASAPSRPGTQFFVWQDKYFVLGRLALGKLRF